nr:Uncharacterised protein [Raoultella sp. NCTC 9187]
MYPPAGWRSPPSPGQPKRACRTARRRKRNRSNGRRGGHHRRGLSAYERARRRRLLAHRPSPRGADSNRRQRRGGLGGDAGGLFRPQADPAPRPARRADRRRDRQRLGRSAPGIALPERQGAAAGASAGRRYRLRQRRDPGHRIPGQRHRRQVCRAQLAAGICRNLSGRRPAAGCRQPLSPARAGQHPQAAGRRGTGQLLSRPAG